MGDRCPAPPRAVSTTLGYTLTLAISTLLVTGLIIAGGNFVSTQREIVIENELEVVGEQVAGQLEQADRLVQASDTSPADLRVNRSIPDQAAGETYDIRLEPSGGSGPAELTLETSNPDIVVTVDIGLESDVQSSVASGGAVVARLDGTRLVISDA